MAATIDITSMFKDFMGAIPFDAKVFEDALKNSASLWRTVRWSGFGSGRKECRSVDKMDQRYADEDVRNVPDKN